MTEKKVYDSNKIFKIGLIIYGSIFAVGIIVACIFGLKLDINFSGGTRITYSYTGKVSTSDFESTVKSALNKRFTVSQNTSLAGDTKTMAINLIGRKSLTAKNQQAITTALTKKFPKNSFELYDSNSVSPTIAGTFFAKSLVAVLLTAILVVIYVGIRFKKIGGFRGALTALCALVMDVFITFFTCVFFRLQIDSNYVAVVLTILGYSLNDTIVVYDRVRENNKLFPQLTTAEKMDKSISGVFSRNLMTSITTVMAVLTIVVVSELYGLSSLRSFAIPMTFGLISGCFSSLFIAGPLWVIWKKKIDQKASEKKTVKAK